MTEPNSLSSDQAAARRARRDAAIRRQRSRILLTTIILVPLGLAGIFFGAMVGGDIGFECFAGTCVTNDLRIWIGTIGGFALVIGALAGSLLSEEPSMWRPALGGAMLAGAVVTVAGAVVGGPSAWTQMLLIFLVGQFLIAVWLLFGWWRMRRRR